MNSRLVQLEFVRAFAFVLIFLCHSVWGTGAAGVSIFLILSGFLLYYNHVETIGESRTIKHSLQFTYRKIKKLFPLHVIMTSLSFAVAMVNGAKTEVIAFLFQIVLAQAWVPIKAIYVALNGVSWYLSVAAFTYFVFPAVLRLIKKIGTVHRMILAIVSIIVIDFILSFSVDLFIGNHDFTIWATFVFPLHRTEDFIIGCIIGALYLKIENSCANKAFLYTTLEGLAIAGVLFVEQLSMNGVFPIWARYQLAFIIPAAFFVFIFALNKGFLSRIMTNKAVFFISSISGYAFLIHQKIIQWGLKAMSLLNIQIGRGYQFLILAIITVLLSATINTVYKQYATSKVKMTH